MLVTLFVTLEVGICCLLILVVLMQPGRGGIGPAFGRGAAQVFGSPATSKILMRTTAIIAAAFLVLTVLLAWLMSRRESRL